VEVNDGGLIGVPEFAKKIAASDGKEYAVDEAEKKDLAYIIENTCMYCGKLMAKDEVKILPPSYIIERDPYVKAGIAKKRLMCVNCYNKIKVAAKERVAFASENKQSGAIRAAIKRFIVARQ